MSFVRYPLYASLIVDGVRHDTLEFSAAGLSLAQPVVEAAGLQHLRRGDECTITLRIGGTGWREEYDVVLRLAARGPAHAGFAFVALPPPARRVLARRSAGRDEAESGEDAPDDVFSGSAGGPAPFAFARLAEPEEPARRCILSVSAAVFAVTQGRSQRRPPPEAGSEDAPPARRKRARPAASGSHPASTAFVYTIALVAVLLISALMVFG